MIVVAIPAVAVRVDHVQLVRGIVVREAVGGKRRVGRAVFG